MLNTYVLGEHVASRWGLSPLVRWSSSVTAVQPGQTPSGDGHETGLFKVAGTAVEATMGGIYHQFVRPFLPSYFFLRSIPIPSSL
jgi:hypothetical protein